ncbi:MAG: transposase [Aminobacterium colombiense]|uniref:transposase n=1 Tax=Aminobacterium colombiense TaxID=81468 RepID=UPI003D95ED4B
MFLVRKVKSKKNCKLHRAKVGWNERLEIAIGFRLNYIRLESLVGKVLNAALKEKAKEVIGAVRYERTEDRKAYRNGYYTRIHGLNSFHH